MALGKDILNTQQRRPSQLGLGAGGVAPSTPGEQTLGTLQGNKAPPTVRQYPTVSGGDLGTKQANTPGCSSAAYSKMIATQEPTNWNDALFEGFYNALMKESRGSTIGESDRRNYYKLIREGFDPDKNVNKTNLSPKERKDFCAFIKEKVQKYESGTTVNHITKAAQSLRSKQLTAAEQTAVEKRIDKFRQQNLGKLIVYSQSPDGFKIHAVRKDAQYSTRVEVDILGRTGAAEATAIVPRWEGSGVVTEDLDKFVAEAIAKDPSSSIDIDLWHLGRKIFSLKDQAHPAQIEAWVNIHRSLKSHEKSEEDRRAKLEVLKTEINKYAPQEGVTAEERGQLFKLWRLEQFERKLKTIEQVLPATSRKLQVSINFIRQRIERGEAVEETEFSAIGSKLEAGERIEKDFEFYHDRKRPPEMPLDSLFEAWMACKKQEGVMESARGENKKVQEAELKRITTIVEGGFDALVNQREKWSRPEGIEPLVLGPPPFSIQQEGGLGQRTGGTTQAPVASWLRPVPEPDEQPLPIGATRPLTPKPPPARPGPTRLPQASQTSAASPSQVTTAPTMAPPPQRELSPSAKTIAGSRPNRPPPPPPSVLPTRPRAAALQRPPEMSDMEWGLLSGRR